MLWQAAWGLSLATWRPRWGLTREKLRQFNEWASPGWSNDCRYIAMARCTKFIPCDLATLVGPSDKEEFRAVGEVLLRWQDRDLGANKGVPREQDRMIGITCLEKSRWPNGNAQEADESIDYQTKGFLAIRTPDGKSVSGGNCHRSSEVKFWNLLDDPVGSAERGKSTMSIRSEVLRLRRWTVMKLFFSL